MKDKSVTAQEPQLHSKEPLTEVEVSAVSELELEMEEGTQIQRPTQREPSASADDFGPLIPKERNHREQDTQVGFLGTQAQAPSKGELVEYEAGDSGEMSSAKELVKLATEQLQERFQHITQDTTDNHRYVDKGRLARGGMSDIRRTFDNNLLRDVAMKVLPDQMARGPGSLQRFLEEAQITGQLEHPNIVPVHDLGIDNHGQLYFTMRWVKGQTLKEYLNPLHYDPSSESNLYHALQIFLKVCDALSFAHSRGVLHRDLKPSNIMVGDHGQVYLMDWGIASIKGVRDSEQDPLTGEIRLQRDPEQETLDVPGSVIGSLRYLSPEQARGEIDKIDERTDLFALGSILYEILTLQPPYTSRKPRELVEEARRCEIVPPQERTPYIHLPKALCNIAMKSLEKEPRKRFQSVKKLKEVLEFFLQGDGRFPRKVFKSGSVLLREGDRGYIAYGIIRGHCQVTKLVNDRRVFIREMGPGEIFGEMALLTSDVRTATVEAIDDVTVMMIHKETLEQELGIDSWMGRLVINLSLRFSEVDKQLIHHQKQIQQSHLLNTLLTLFHISGENNEDGRARASWSSLRKSLQTQTSLSEQELLTQLKDFPFLIIDWDLDLIYLHKQRLGQWHELFQLPHHQTSFPP